ncbi:unnamed protein product, partial [Rotaria sp. Silwood1]
EYSYNEEGVFTITVKIGLLFSLFYLAKKFIKEIIYNYDVVSSDKSNDDDFIASLYQKSIERVERLSLPLHILKNSARHLFSMTENIQSFTIFDDRFKTICTEQQLTEAEH